MNLDPHGLLFGIKGFEPLEDVLLTQVAHGLDIAPRDLQDFVGGIGLWYLEQRPECYAFEYEEEVPAKRGGL
jgi:hypothetical protein